MRQRESREDGMCCSHVESQGAMETPTLTLRLVTLLLQWNTNQVFRRIERRQNIECGTSSATLTISLE